MHISATGITFSDPYALVSSTIDDESLLAYSSSCDSAPKKDEPRDGVNTIALQKCQLKLNCERVVSSVVAKGTLVFTLLETDRLGSTSFAGQVL